MKVLGGIKPKGLNMIAKIRKCLLCLREENLSLRNCKLHYYYINHVSAGALTTGRMIPSGTNNPPAEVSAVVVMKTSNSSGTLKSPLQYSDRLYFQLFLVGPCLSYFICFITYGGVPHDLTIIYYE